MPCENRTGENHRGHGRIVFMMLHVRSVEDTIRSERIMQHVGRNGILSFLCGYDFKILQKSRREER